LWPIDYKEVEKHIASYEIADYDWLHLCYARTHREAMHIVNEKYLWKAEIKPINWAVQ
jgi:hypothetical protein